MDMDSTSVSAILRRRPVGSFRGCRELAEESLQITLALSLHGSTQEKRQNLMPVAHKYQLPEVLEACDYYFAKTGRRVTFEYSLVKGVNDTAMKTCRELTQDPEAPELPS